MTLKLLACTFAGLVVSSAAIAGQQPAADSTVVDQFNKSVAAYDDIHQRFAWRVPVQVCKNPEDILNGSTALAEAIRGARPDARRGDVFTPQVSALFRDRIRWALKTCHVPASSLLAALTREAPAATTELTVNGRFDWRFGAAMPSMLIDVLPRLPDSLQYRFVRKDLVLVDIDANLIVDVLAGALEVE